MSDILVVLLASSFAGLLSLSVALILLGSEKLSSKLVKYGTPFAAGVLLIIAFRDLLPEAIVEDGADVLNSALGAILIFFLIEKGFKSFHHHHEEDQLEKTDTTQGWLFVIGDLFHNLIDGISLGGAFLIGRDTGLVATVALVAHDIPLEVGEFGNQLRVGFTKRQTIIRNILSGSTTIIGAVLTYQIGGDLDIPMGYLYGGIAGFFIYIALSDIVPTIHSSEKTRYGLQTGFLLFGLIFGGTVSALAHDYIDVGHNHDEEDHNEEGHDEEDHNEEDHNEEGHDEEDHNEEGHDEEGHDEEGHDEEDHNEEDHNEEGHNEEGHHDEVEVAVPSSAPEQLQVLNFNLGEKIELNFSSTSETEIHVHGYDIHFIVQPNKENILEIELTIAGEFEIEEHDGGFEFARMIVSP
ncbi:MAG: ZIP family metal transporter [Actinobacteria bacterium]|nr:ZIP family metal transporter [Actinomycetota bacterium]